MSCRVEFAVIINILASGTAQQIGAADGTEAVGGSSRLFAAADLNRYAALAIGEGVVGEPLSMFRVNSS